MKTLQKTKPAVAKKLSKAGKALRAGKGKGMFIIPDKCFADDDVK